MKTLKLIILGIVLIFAGSAHAQVSVSLNIGSPPMWGPVGYTDVQYYYLPDVEAYYDVNSSMFIYYSGRTWVHRSYLPSRYRNYDLYGGYKVVMNDYHGNTPYAHFREYRMKYKRGYHGDMQRTIGERPGRGNMSPKNSRHGNHLNQGHENGNGNGDSKSFGRGNSGGHGNGGNHNNGVGHGKRK
jgi:hypothetical protein